jgi:ABC-type ATPase involved in cell division
VGLNGSGKTTFVKLAGLYRPSAGTIRYQGRDLGEWDPVALRSRIGVIFQDFNRYQITVGENIGAGDVTAFDDRARWSDAAAKGQASEFIAALPAAYDTQLGRWFNNGQELSGGQWQRIALARAFMRAGAEILVLDEPTASMDAEPKRDLDHFRSLTATDPDPDLASVLDGAPRRSHRGARPGPDRELRDATSSCAWAAATRGSSTSRLARIGEADRRSPRTGSRSRTASRRCGTGGAAATTRGQLRRPPNSRKIIKNRFTKSRYSASAPEIANAPDCGPSTCSAMTLSRGAS